MTAVLRPYFVFAFLLLPALAWSAPRVTVSIAPLHGLVADIMAGVGEPALLYDSRQSPHTAALSPRQLKSLVGSDMLIWVGPELETGLARLVGRLPETADNLYWPNYEEAITVLHRREPLFETGEGENHGHDHGERDPHFWLSIDNAIRFARLVDRRLAERDPDHAEQYHHNTDRLVADLTQLKDRLDRRLAPVRDKPFMVFHDGFQYFERSLDLHALGALVLQPDVPPGPRTVQRLAQAAEPYDGLCLFYEPQFDDRWMRTLARQIPGARIARIDPLGVTQTPGRGHYQSLMTQLADDLAGCLEQLP